MKEKFFTFSWQIILLSLAISAMHFMLILQLIPVFEDSSFLAEAVNLVVFPANFLFEDVFGITSNRFFDALTWIFHIFYGYFLISTVRFMLRK